MSGAEHDKHDKDDKHSKRGSKERRSHGPTRRSEKRETDPKEQRGKEQDSEREKPSPREGTEGRGARPKLPGIRRFRPGAPKGNDHGPDQGNERADEPATQPTKPVLPRIQGGHPGVAPKKDIDGPDTGDHEPSGRPQGRPSLEKGRHGPALPHVNGKDGPTQHRINGVDHGPRQQADRHAGTHYGHPEAAPSRRGDLTEQQRVALGVVGAAVLLGTRPGRQVLEFGRDTIRRQQEIEFARASTPDTVINHYTEINNNYGGGHHHHSHGPAIVSGCGPVYFPPSQTVILVGPPPPPPMPTIVIIQPPPLPPPTVVVIQRPPVVAEVHTLLSRCSHEEQRMFIMAAEAYHVTGDARAGMFAASFLENKGGFAFSGSYSDVGGTMTQIGANVSVLRRGLGDHTNVAFNFIQREGGGYGLDNDTASFFQINLSHIDFD